MVSKLRQTGAMLAFLALAATAASAQQATITGRVTSDAGTPLPSASVFLDGMSIGTVTRDDGTVHARRSRRTRQRADRVARRAAHWLQVGRRSR